MELIINNSARLIIVHLRIWKHSIIVVDILIIENITTHILLNIRITIIIGICTFLMNIFRTEKQSKVVQ